MICTNRFKFCSLNYVHAHSHTEQRTTVARHTDLSVTTDLVRLTDAEITVRLNEVSRLIYRIVTYRLDSTNFSSTLYFSMIFYFSPRVNRVAATPNRLHTHTHSVPSLTKTNQSKKFLFLADTGCPRLVVFIRLLLIGQSVDPLILFCTSIRGTWVTDGGEAY